MPQEKKEKTNKDSNKISGKYLPMKKLLIPVFLLVVLITAYTSMTLTQKFLCKDSKTQDPSTYTPGTLMERVSFDLVKFESAEEFKDYLSKAPERAFGLMAAEFAAPRNVEMMALDEAVGMGAAPNAMVQKAAPDRTSQTNVQVEGIDEPDIVKVGDNNIFTSFPTRTYYQRPVIMEEPAEIGIPRPIEDEILPPQPQERTDGTNIIQAFPPEEIQKLGGIEEIGNLLYVNDMLIVFTYQEIFGYNVSNPSIPVQSWSIPYGDNSYYSDARLYGDKLYLVTQTGLRRGDPCPITPLVVKGEDLSIPCTEIYHPRTPVITDITYTVFKIDSKSGDVSDQISFVGTGNDAILYMSTNNLYITYSYAEDYVNIFLGFITQEETDLFPENVISEIRKISSYDISQMSKMTELQLIIDEYIYSLPEDESLEIENNLSDKLEDYTQEHARDFTTTGIVKIDRDNLKIGDTGKVPGYPLNQFSLDEYENHLRIATTAGQLDSWSSVGKVNDVYILDNKMKVVGEVLDLGKDERIYSARFIGDKGYVVTFRQTDPFYVLDLSNPKNPKMTGELKIPGYSSYLHPLDKNIILGIGKEDNQVKLSLFDVSNPQNPTEIDKYMLDEYYTDVINTHHAFLQDSRHEVFFIPANQGGYIFSYDGNELELEMAVATQGVKRAVYMDDYMYIIGDTEIVIIDELTWERVGEFEF